MMIIKKNLCKGGASTCKDSWPLRDVVALCDIIKGFSE